MKERLFDKSVTKYPYFFSNLTNGDFLVSILCVMISNPIRL